jgi:hypothetical protein
MLVNQKAFVDIQPKLFPGLLRRKMGGLHPFHLPLRVSGKIFQKGAGSGADIDESAPLRKQLANFGCFPSQALD